MQLKYSSPSPALMIMLLITRVVAVVPIFPFQSLASVGTGTETDPSGMLGRQCCPRLLMGYISLDKLMLPDTHPGRATLQEQAASTHHKVLFHLLPVSYLLLPTNKQLKT